MYNKLMKITHTKIIVSVCIGIVISLFTAFPLYAQSEINNAPSGIDIHAIGGYITYNEYSSAADPSCISGQANIDAQPKKPGYLTLAACGSDAMQYTKYFGFPFVARIDTNITPCDGQCDHGEYLVPSGILLNTLVYTGLVLAVIFFVNKLILKHNENTAL